MHRPAVLRVPGAVVEAAAGRMANEVLGSTTAVPQVLLDSGYDFSDPDVRAVLREGARPESLTLGHPPGPPRHGGT